MNIKILINTLALFCYTITSAQNNTIFFGGISDGHSSNIYSQQNTNTIYLGNIGDGWQSANFKQDSVVAIYKGSNGDGWHAATYEQDVLTNVFLGGTSDGWHSNNYSQLYTTTAIGGSGIGWIKGNYKQDSIAYNYRGSNSDGWSTLNTIQSSIDDRFLGAIGDGWVSQSVTLPLNPLSLAFLSFKGSVVNDEHFLQWTTLNEENTAHFILEHSIDNLNFKALTKVDASKNTIGEKAYNFTNTQPKIGNNFYRLKLINIDGSQILSNAVLLQLMKDNTTINAYPNPTATLLNIEVNSSSLKNNLAVYVLELNGKILHQQEIKSGNIISINTQPWAPGIYVVKVIHGTQSSILKVLKQ